MRLKPDPACQKPQTADLLLDIKLNCRKTKFKPKHISFQLQFPHGHLLPTKTTSRSTRRPTTTRGLYGRPIGGLPRSAMDVLGSTLRRTGSSVAERSNKAGNRERIRTSGLLVRSRLEAIAGNTVATRLEAIATRLEAIVSDMFYGQISK